MEPPPHSETDTEIRSYFVRGRNALLARADFGGLYIDYYLHQGQYGFQHEPAHDGLLKETLAAIGLHCASRPWNEAPAWTIHLEDPLLNLFAAGDNRRGTLIGQLFTDNVKRVGQPRFISDVARERAETRRSVVDLDGVRPDIFVIAERYYEKSEQRPARFFRAGPEDFVLVSAQPDCDLDWLASLNDDLIGTLDQRETLALLEQRHYRWECGCSQQRMHAVLAPMLRTDAEHLFAGEPSLRMSCPRCGARYVITREGLEAFVADTSVQKE